MHFQRLIQDQIVAKLFKGKAVLIYGARRVGKTTLCQELLKKFPSNSQYFNCDEPDVREAFANKTSTELKHFIGNKGLIVLDEAQRVKNIGLTIKLLVDNYPEMQVIATGSSSFDLVNKVSEPLTGRSYEFTLYPMSMLELRQQYSELEVKRLIEQFLRFGTYPEILNQSHLEAQETISGITKNYLYRDILEFEKLKNPELLQKLLQTLALQVGHEVSYTELAKTLSVNKITIERYIQILEKSFVIFRLGPFSRNLRNEINKMRKIYFYDLGIRNSLIRNFNELALRMDVGGLWENFCVLERMKINAIKNRLVNAFFWRTYDKSEIDYLEEYEGKLKAFEFKWSDKKVKIPKAFLAAYSEASIDIINKENFLQFVT